MKAIDQLQVGEIFALIHAARRVSVAKQAHEAAITELIEDRFDARVKDMDEIVDEMRHAELALLALAREKF